MTAADMTAAELLAELLPRWRESLPPQYIPAVVEGFLRRQRGTLEVLTIRALARHQALRGDLPDTVAEFAAFDPIMAEERRRDAKPDAVLLRHLMTRVAERVARGLEPEITVLAMVGDDYVMARAEAILLRHAGWDAVPLMLVRPALAVAVAGSVVALRDMRGRLAIDPLRRGELNHLRADISKAEIRTLYLRQAIEIPFGTKEALMRFAMDLWALAREPAPPGVATPRRPS